MPLPSRRTTLSLAETLVIGTIGGGALALAGLPAGWLSGAMIVVAVAALAGRPMVMPAPLARVIFVLIGISLGGAVTPETLRGVATWPLSVALLCVAMISATFGSAYYLRKVHGWDMLSALFGSASGALSQVIAHASQNHSDLRGIAIVQTIRVVILTACVPVALAAFGLIPDAPAITHQAVSDSMTELGILVVVSTIAAIALHMLRFPGGLIFGAMLASAILHGTGLSHAAMPWWIVNAVMVGLGALTGSRFANTQMRMLLQYAVAGIGSFAVSIAITGMFAVAAVWLLKLHVPDIVVAFAPGALDAMMILALALHLDPIFVGAHHIARFLLISLSLPVFVRLYRQPPPAPPQRADRRPVRED